MENATVREGAKAPAPVTYILVSPDPDSPTAAPARYTDASLKSTLQLMGWKTRLAHKVALQCGVLGLKACSYLTNEFCRPAKHSSKSYDPALAAVTRLPGTSA